MLNKDRDISSIDTSSDVITYLLRGLYPEKTMNVSDWADTYRMLPAATSAEPGKYSSSRTPYWIEVMNNFSPDNPTKRTVVVKSTQVGFTEMLVNILGYIIHKAPTSVISVMPTQHMSNIMMKQRFEPMIEATPELKARIATGKQAVNTRTTKQFVDGILNAVSATSPNQLRSSPAEHYLADEVDSYEQESGDEGHPIYLLRRRQDTYRNGKSIEGSTPVSEDLSLIWGEFLLGDQRYYNVPCPFCKTKQRMIFTQLKYEVDENTKLVKENTTRYQCIECDELIEEKHKTWMMAFGEWIPTNPNASKDRRSYSINALYSPLGMKSWESICEDYEEATRDPLKMKAFTNTVLGEIYKDESVVLDYMELYNRRESYKEFEAHSDIIYCCAGLDTQDDRIAICVLGFGADSEIWVLGYKEIWGVPSDPETWIKVRRYVDTPIKHKSGVNLSIRDCFIDSQGHYTEYVYDFCKRNQDKFIPIGGRGNFSGSYLRKGKSIDQDMHGRAYAGSLEYYQINTVLTKKTVYNLLSKKEDEYIKDKSRYVHFGSDLDKSFFEMLCSEKLVTRVKNGKVKEEFIKVHNRNEAIDCFAYAYALAFHKGINSIYGKTYNDVYKNVITNNLKVVTENNNSERKQISPQKVNRFSGGKKLW